MAIKVVIDTNALVSSLSSKSEFHKLIKLVLNGEVEVFVTDEIMMEYEEILSKKYSSSVANNFLNALRELSNVHYTQVFYRWNLLKDPDDNKFTDCYIAANAHFIVTNDAGFNKLSELGFPVIQVIRLEKFLQEDFTQ